ncbi:hypothetical protein KKA95_00630 [Patescibacteria group bacterium]|nr:hypothetical protein [Patescibacteria group bacterium]
MRSKKGGIKAWLIFVLIIVISFGALLYLKNFYKSAEEEVAVVTEDGAPGKGFAKLPEFTEEEKAELDNDALNNALSSGNLEDCEEITYDEELKQQCYDNLNYSKILRSGDESQCESLSDPDLKQQCYDKIYFSAAMDTFDLSLCEKITDVDLKDNCSNQIKVVMGRTASSAADCDSISDSVLKQECLNNYYFSSSTDELNVESCSSITNVQLQSRCVSTVEQNIKVIELSKQTVVDLPESTEEILEACQTADCKDNANYDLAFEEKDLSYCNKLSTSEGVQSCLKEQTENLDQYYLRQAIAMRDESICSQIADDSLQELCTSSI